MARYDKNIDKTYEENTYVEKNSFIGKEKTRLDIPNFNDIKEELPRPIFDGHEDYIACYYKAWEIAFGNLKHPCDNTDFVSDFIDTAFNGCLFMWDSALIMMFTKYAERIFPFMKTLDNFYSNQHKDGFICRMIDEITGQDGFTRFDPSSTGPNILAFSEWKYFEDFGDIERLRSVYAPLRAYHIWLRKNMTWRDGTYYSSGWGCGMDNTPRLPKIYNQEFSHGHMVWIDATLQAIISAKTLIKMNEVLGSLDDVSDLVFEIESLRKILNEKMWDEKSGFYYDLWRDGSLNYVKHVSVFWALHTSIMSKEQTEALVSHLRNEEEFNTVTPIPSLSKDHPSYRPDGGYALGSSIASTSYMTLSGLCECGYHSLAYELACKYLDTVVTVFNERGTIFENYAPDMKAPGNPSKPDFVGWSGLIPISIFFENVLGIKKDVPSGKIVWHVKRTERHGIENYPFGLDTTVSLICEERASEDEMPKITVKSNKKITVSVFYADKTFDIISEE